MSSARARHVTSRALHALGVRTHGEGGTPPPGFFRSERGYIDLPAAGDKLPRDHVDVRGWCLFPDTSVARVELRLNSGTPERARLGIERREISEYTTHPDAPICAFEHKLDLSGIGDDVESVTLDAVAYALDGRELRLSGRQFALLPRVPEWRDRDGEAAELRGRSVVPAGVAADAGGGLRLLAFSHMLVHGGGSLYLFELLRRLSADHGFDCHVVSAADGPLRARFEEIGIPVHLTDGFPVTSVARYEGHLAELVGWSAGRGFDVALVNTLGAFPGADLATRLGIPLVWAVHESFTLPAFWSTAYLPGTLHPYARAQAESALRSASAVVFEAEATRRLLLAGADDDRWLTVPYGIELDSLDDVRAPATRREARRRMGVDDDAQVLLCLGSIEPRKSQAMLAAAFARICERHPRAQLVLVGANGEAYCAEYRRALRAFVERAGLERRVRIEPVTDEPFAWHAIADFLVCASDVESLPRSILEAMACGTPVLSTSVFGVPEVIEDGRTGYLVDTRDAGALARGLDRALSVSTEELEEVSRAAAARVRERHDPVVYAARMGALLRGLAADPSAVAHALLNGADTPVSSPQETSLAR